jgi:hypothetical protein
MATPLLYLLSNTLLETTILLILYSLHQMYPTTPLILPNLKVLVNKNFVVVKALSKMLVFSY